MNLILTSVFLFGMLGATAVRADLPAVCSVNLFADSDGGGRYEEIKLGMKKTSFESAIALIINNATNAHTDELCTSNSSTCFSINGETEFYLERVKDQQGRILGNNGVIKIPIDSFKTALGWSAKVSEVYRCSWGETTQPLCVRSCEFRTNDGAGW